MESLKSWELALMRLAPEPVHWRERLPFWFPSLPFIVIFLIGLAFSDGFAEVLFGLAAVISLEVLIGSALDLRRRAADVSIEKHRSARPGGKFRHP
jgi:hypothetical protein